MRFMRKCVVLAFTIHHKLFNTVEKIGIENIPKEGGYVLCSNHIHWQDPFLYVSSTKRMIYAIAKEELFSSPLKAWVMKRLGLIEVKRDGSGSNKEAIQEAVNVLKSGELLIIYPEGTRFGLKKGIKPKKGVAFIALEARVPIIPMAMVGSFKRGSVIKFIVDKPMDISEYYPKEGEKVNPRNVVKVTNMVMDRIIELRDSINTEEIEREMNEAEEEREKKKLKKKAKKEAQKEEVEKLEGN